MDERSTHPLSFYRIFLQYTVVNAKFALTIVEPISQYFEILMLSYNYLLQYYNYPLELHYPMTYNAPNLIKVHILQLHRFVH